MSLPLSPLVSGGERYGVLPVPLLLLLLPRGSPPAPALTPTPPRHHSGGLRRERIVRLVGDVAALLIIVTEVSGVVEDVSVTAWMIMAVSDQILRADKLVFDIRYLSERCNSSF